jgi:hypothetical protein
MSASKRSKNTKKYINFNKKKLKFLGMRVGPRSQMVPKWCVANCAVTSHRHIGVFVTVVAVAVQNIFHSENTSK